MPRGWHDDLGYPGTQLLVKPTTYAEFGRRKSIKILVDQAVKEELQLMSRTGLGQVVSTAHSIWLAFYIIDLDSSRIFELFYTCTCPL